MRLAPQLGHVSNFCSLNADPLEPAELLHYLENSDREITGIQAGRPYRLCFEP